MRLVWKAVSIHTRGYWQHVRSLPASLLGEGSLVVIRQSYKFDALSQSSWLSEKSCLYRASVGSSRPTGPVTPVDGGPLYIRTWLPGNCNYIRTGPDIDRTITEMTR